VALNQTIIGDTSSHGGAVTSGSYNTFVNNIPKSRKFDILACPIHGPNPIMLVSPNAFTNDSRGSSRITSVCACGAVIITGNSPDTFTN
jgi:uncharacterized Zn-binding protein involved in type VI secretion